MNPKQPGLFVLLGLLILALLAASCAPQATPTTALPETAAPAQTQAPPVATEAPTQAPPTAAPASPTPAEEKPTGTLNVALTTDPNAIVLAMAAERQASIASQAFFDTMLFPLADGSVEPALLTGCENTPDYKTFTCTLRKDVTFHNGEPFNAEAIIFTFQVLSDPKVQYPFLGPDKITVSKIDDYTVKFDLVDPEPNFLWNRLSGYEVIPPKYFQEMGSLEAFAEKPVGTGPFVFKEWVKGDHITGTANPNYWRKGYPKVAEVVFKTISENATRVAAIQTGEVDIATRLTVDEVEPLRNDPNIKVIEYPVDRVYYVAFNNRSTGKGTPIEKKEVRQALNYAVDRQAIIDALFSGKAALATSLVVPGDIGYVKQEPYPFDPEKAKQLLAAAGYPDGFSIDMACPDQAYSHINEVCEAIVGYLDKVGVKAKLEFMESGKFWDLEAKQQLPPLFVDSWSASGNPFFRILGALGKDQTYAAWYEQRYQDWLDKINSTGDLNEINQYYAEMQQAMYEDPPFVYLYIPYTFEAINSKLSGYEPRANEHYWLWMISKGQ